MIYKDFDYARCVKTYRNKSGNRKQYLLVDKMNRKVLFSEETLIERITKHGMRVTNLQVKDGLILEINEMIQPIQSIVHEDGKKYTEYKVDNTLDTGEIPDPLEIEHKYLIEKPQNIGKNLIEIGLKLLTKYEITQDYLVGKVDVTERRVRKRRNLFTGKIQYFYTEKTFVSQLIRIENEMTIQEQEYEDLLRQKDPELNTVRKIRCVFDYDGQTFELDVYSFSDRYAILEIEVKNPRVKVRIPKGLKVIKEVTDDKRYKNKSLAKSLKLEE